MRRLVAPASMIAAMYATIWPHELGHSVVAYALGCKADPWRTDMSPYLWGSWGGAIDWDCLAARGHGAVAATAAAGVLVNLTLVVAARLVGRWWRPTEQRSTAARLLYAFTVVWALGNAAEACSYLVLNTAWLKSDMALVVEDSGISRWILFSAGVALTLLFVRTHRAPVLRAATVLAPAPGQERRLQRILWGYAVVASIVMVAGRVHFT